MTPLPHLTLVWPRAGCELAVSAGRFPAAGGIGAETFYPAPTVVRDRGRAAVVIGSAILGERIDPEAVGRLLLSAGDLDRAVRQVNGQFLVVIGDPTTRTLTLISDRHTGIPFYFAELGDRLVGSFLYSDLTRLLRSEGRLRLVPEHLFEFLWLQRLLMDRTHDAGSRFLPAATILTFQDGAVSERRYWRPDFTKNERRGARESGAELAEGMRRSLARRTTDRKRYGLFLSGGHDSRTILAALPQAPVCFTVGYTDNYEVGCARQMAAIADAPFVYLPLPSDHLDRIADDAAALCSGLYSIDHALFLGHHDTVSAQADVVFHGHGIDYMYQGMYLPAEYVSFAGRPTFFRRLTRLPDDLVEAFLNGISFRLKYVDLMWMVRPEWHGRLRDHLQQAAGAVIADSADVAQNDADRWEYFLIHALGRHFSWPNVGSKMSGVEQRIASFDNDLFDFYLSLPAEQRVTAAALRHAQVMLNRDIAMAPTGNWGMPAAYSPMAKTAWQVGRKLLRHATGIQRFRPPHAEDRTWPDRDRHLCGEPAWRARVAAALADEELEASLPFLNWPKLRDAAAEWMAKPSGGAALLVELLTLQLFLKTTH